MKDKTLCLCMIVKNESHIILETLNSIKKYLDYWVICDTGSTDNTPELIKDFFNKEGIKGELHFEKWKNFGYNRTLVFNYAYKKADYLWVIDADDFLIGDLDLKDLSADSYRLKYILGPITYFRDQIFRGDLKWEYKGVLHEYAHCISKKEHSGGVIEGNYYINARTVGARSKIDPKTKYLADAHTLEQALKIEKDTDLVARYLFYLAQSYRDAGENKLAIKWYQKRVEHGGWVEEVWYSKYQIGSLFEMLGDYKNALVSYLDAFEYRPSRAESLHSLGKMCNIRREFFQAHMYLDYASRIPYTKDILFVNNSVYDYEIVFELSISTYWIGDYKQSVALCDKLVTMKDKIPPNIYEQTLKNREFGVAKLTEPDPLQLANARIPYSGCPLCNSTENTEVMLADCSNHPLYKTSLPNMQRWLACSNCGHVYVDGYFSQEALALLFSDTHANQSPGYDIENQRYTWARVLDKVSSLRSCMGGRWLDVGFGSGSLLSTAEEFGYEVVGLDLRKESVRLMREFGYEVHSIEFEDYQDSQTFDVISLADALEHMPYPKPVLHHAYDLLRPGGLLFLSMPNIDSFLWRFLTQNGVNPYWGEIEHYHNFGRKRLYALLDECGFQPVCYSVSTRYRACMEIIAKKVDRNTKPS